MFGIVEKDVPPDIGRLLGGVSLLFTPLGLRSPPASFRYFCVCLGYTKFEIKLTSGLCIKEGNCLTCYVCFSVKQDFWSCFVAHPHMAWVAG